MNIPNTSDSHDRLPEKCKNRCFFRFLAPQWPSNKLAFLNSLPLCYFVWCMWKRFGTFLNSFTLYRVHGKRKDKKNINSTSKRFPIKIWSFRLSFYLKAVFVVFRLVSFYSKISYSIWTKRDKESLLAPFERSQNFHWEKLSQNSFICLLILSFLN